MASYKGHLAFAAPLGFVYGGMARSQLGFEADTAMVGALLTTVGGLLPDLDSDSGVPVRELFSLAAVMVPLLMWRRLMNAHFTDESMFLFLAVVYLLIRFVISRIFKHLSVHRGMYHSIPAMLIAGLIVFLAYQHPSMRVRLFLSVGVMIGFPLARSIREPVPMNVQRAVKRTILGLVFLDATLATAFVGLAGLLVLLWLPPALLLGKWVYST